MDKRAPIPRIRNVLAIHLEDDANALRTVYQEEIDDLLQRKRTFDQSRRRYLALRNYLIREIELGAQVENGLHQVRIREVLRARSTFSRLIVW